MVLSNFPQGSKSFERWSQEISDAARYDNYDWKQAVVDAILLQTSNSRLRERALQDNVSYDALVKLGIAKEQSVKGAALLDQASARIKIEEEVQRLQIGNKRLKRGKTTNTKWCYRCGLETCQQNSKCPANEQRCSKCKKMNHYARVCRASTLQKPPSFGKVSDSSNDSNEEVSGHITVSKLDATNILANICGTAHDSDLFQMATDTGVSKSIRSFHVKSSRA